MGSVWLLLALVVVGAVLLALGLVRGVAGAIVVGFLALALAAIVGSKGRLPEGH
ncbi:MAG TPA: hypothetical protein VG370_27810 [Chloroflexota bacterium]|jgi:hypothetical protein|nr:hypothetical protein [Chloroflexota bacterium]